MSPECPHGHGITIGAANNRLEWTERVTTAPATKLTYAYCSATLANATYTGDAGMAALAADITAKMIPTACVQIHLHGPPPAPSRHAPGTPSRPTWSTPRRPFTLTRGGTGRYYQMRFAAPNSASATLGWGAANIP